MSIEFDNAMVWRQPNYNRQPDGDPIYREAEWVSYYIRVNNLTVYPVDPEQHPTSFEFTWSIWHAARTNNAGQCIAESETALDDPDVALLAAEIVCKTYHLNRLKGGL